MHGSMRRREETGQSAKPRGPSASRRPYLDPPGVMRGTHPALEPGGAAKSDTETHGCGPGPAR
jgi:hypothetical protein